jgi:hypothetical protein
MKKLLLLALIVCFLIPAVNAQLANTKWAGTINVLMQDNSTSATDVTWSFGKDTVSVLIKDSNDPELLTYMVKKGVIIMTKVTGESPCNVGTTVKVKFQVKGNELYFMQAESECEAYSKAITDKPAIKIK